MSMSLKPAWAAQQDDVSIEKKKHMYLASIKCKCWLQNVKGYYVNILMVSQNSSLHIRHRALLLENQEITFNPLNVVVILRTSTGFKLLMNVEVQGDISTCVFLFICLLAVFLKGNKTREPYIGVPYSFSLRPCFFHLQD